MPKITTTSGYEIIVDESAFKWASNMRWNVSPRGYARTWIKNADKTRKYVNMHRLVIKADSDQIVDHINRNKLDNRAENLRIVSSQLNSINRKSVGQSKYKGVGKHKGGWQVYVGGRYIGLFKEEVVAAKAYDAEAEKFYGSNAVTNKILGLL
jgi:hypothetical protein